MKRLALALAIATLVPVRAVHAECARINHWWELVEIRKSFDGGSGEGEAANVGLVNAAKDTSTTWFLDGGIRTKRCEIPFGDKSGGKTPPTLYWFPSAEWHHLSAEPLRKQGKTEQASGALNAEVWFGDPNQPLPRWYFVAKGAVTRDLLNDKTIKSADLLVSVYQEGGLHPGHAMRSTHRYWGTYFPYLGFQYFRSLAITQNGAVVAPTFDGGAGMARIQFELYPLLNKDKIPGEIPFTVSGEYSYRRLLADAPSIDTRNMSVFDVAFTWYPDAGHTIGLGLTVTKGRSPKTNFISQQRVVIGVKIKR